MSARRIGLALVALFLFPLLLVGLAQAQGFGFDQEESSQAPVGVEVFVDPAAVDDPPPAAGAAPATVAEEPAGSDLSQEPQGDVGVATVLSSIIPFQGRLTSASGSPLSGSYAVTLSLYDVPVGGTALCADTDTVDVVKGLFTMYMNTCTASNTDGRQLYLGIKVDADPEMTPRQPVYAAPYARSLRPGAIVNQTSGGLHGLTVQSAGNGAAGAAVWAANTNTTPGGIGLWSTVAGTDASIVASNNGTGPLFKGFGWDGGEDEIRINNNGSIETKANSYIFVPGCALVKNLSADTTRWDIQPTGAARIWRGANAGGKTVYFPVTLPTQLYGQSVEVKSVTVYYKVSNGSQAYITDTYVNKQIAADSAVALIASNYDRISTTAAGYILFTTANNVLEIDQGLAVWLNLAFLNDSDWVQIGGIRIQLGHHSLY